MRSQDWNRSLPTSLISCGLIVVFGVSIWGKADFQASGLTVGARRSWVLFIYLFILLELSSLDYNGDLLLRWHPPGQERPDPQEQSQSLNIHSPVHPDLALGEGLCPVHSHEQGRPQAGQLE